MTEYRRQFTAVAHGDGLLITAGNRSLRLSADEKDDLTAVLAGPVIAREVARVTGLEK